MTELAEITQEVNPMSVALATARAEIDGQIATAKAYPRNTKRAFDAIVAAANFNANVAEKCVYRVPRQGKTIEGPSIRLAEIIAREWGNLRIGSRVIEETGTSIVVQAFAHDLETNVAVTSEIRLRITTKDGKRYSDDMITMTANSGQSKAIRNAILRIFPRVVADEIVERCKDTFAKKGPTLSDRWGQAVKYGAEQWGLQPDSILALVGKQTANELTFDDILTIKTVYEEVKADKEKLAEYFPAAKSRTDAVKERLAGNKQPEPPKSELFNQTDTSAIKG